MSIAKRIRGPERFPILASLTIVALGAAFVATSSTPAIAETPPGESPFPSTTIIQRPIDHPITMSQAVTLGATIGQPVLAYHYDNDFVIGEFSPSADQSPADFDDQFVMQYGTEPQVDAFVVEAATVVDTNGNLATPDGPTVISGLPAFNAAAPQGGQANAKLSAFAAQSRAAAATRDASLKEKVSGARTAAVAPEWRPDQIQTSITHYGSHAYFNWYVAWYPGSSSPHNVPSGYGIEIGDDLYNSASSSALRPLGCSAGYKDAFFAKDYNWNWSVLNSDYSSLPKSIKAYADYNDLWDTCNRNNVTIGIANPQSIPTSPNNPGWALMIFVDAPKGTASTNKIGGEVQLVDNAFCALSLGTTSLTDCMGAAERTPVDTTIPTSRATLNKDRNWTAPDKCWMSSDFGLTAPQLINGTNGCGT